MTPRITLIIGIAVAALAVGVPAAFGEGSLGGSQEPSDGVKYFYSVERATAAQAGETALSSYRDAFERGSVTKPGVHSSLSGYRDAFERGTPETAALQTSQMMAEDGFDKAVALANQRGLGSVLTYRDSFERATPVKPVTGLHSKRDTYRDGAERAVPIAGPSEVATISSGRELHWPQIGIGFGIGIALMFGLWLAMRVTRIRPLAH